MSNIDWTKLVTAEDKFKATVLEAKATVKAEHARLLRLLTGDAGEEERDTWMPKGLAASAFTQGTETASQLEMLQDEADEIGTSVEALAGEILAKQDANLKLIGKASGLRRKVIAALSEVKTVQDIASTMASASQRSAELIQAWQEDVTT